MADWPIDGCKNAEELGFLHGCEDQEDEAEYSPGVELTDIERWQYIDAYNYARRISIRQNPNANTSMIPFDEDDVELF